MSHDALSVGALKITGTVTIDLSKYCEGITHTSVVPSHLFTSSRGHFFALMLGVEIRGSYRPLRSVVPVPVISSDIATIATRIALEIQQAAEVVK